MTTTNYLVNPRLNRNSGAKPSIPLQSKVLEHESLEYRSVTYQDKYYSVVDVILSNNYGEIIKVESYFSLID